MGFSRYTPDVVILHSGRMITTRMIIWQKIITVHVPKTGGSITADFRASYGSISEGNLYIDNHNIGT